MDSAEFSCIFTPVLFVLVVLATMGRGEVSIDTMLFATLPVPNYHCAFVLDLWIENRSGA